MIAAPESPADITLINPDRYADIGVHLPEPRARSSCPLSIVRWRAHSALIVRCERRSASVLLGRWKCALEAFYLLCRRHNVLLAFHECAFCAAERVHSSPNCKDDLNKITDYPRRSRRLLAAPRRRRHGPPPAAAWGGTQKRTGH